MSRLSTQEVVVNQRSFALLTNATAELLYFSWWAGIADDSSRIWRVQLKCLFQNSTVWCARSPPIWAKHKSLWLNAPALERWTSHMYVGPFVRTCLFFVRTYMYLPVHCSVLNPTSLGLGKADHRDHSTRGNSPLFCAGSVSDLLAKSHQDTVPVVLFRLYRRWAKIAVCRSATEISLDGK